MKDETLAIKSMENNPAPGKTLESVSCRCKKPKCASGQCQFCEVKLKYIELSSCARCENMDGDHYNDEEIDVQRVSDDDYDSGTDRSEYS